MSHAHSGHDHDHDPRIPPSDKDSYETANRNHFDVAAQQYNDRPNAQKRAEQIGRAIVNTGLFKQGITTVLDFACGTGHLSRVLAAEDPKLIIGADISQAMVDQYNKIVSDHGIPPEEMRAVCVPPHEKLQGTTFDVIVCASAYHHFPSIEEMTTFLVSTYLRPGGSLLVVDLIHGESAHETFPEHVHHIVAHRGGFTEGDIRSAFEKAGLKSITFEAIVRAKHAGHQVDLFLARGDKESIVRM